MTYRVEIRSGVSDYLRGLEGFTREGRLAPQPKSLMPELLLRDLTAELAADLLAFLASLR
jgi:hypothetical protein